MCYGSFNAINGALAIYGASMRFYPWRALFECGRLAMCMRLVWYRSEAGNVDGVRRWLHGRIAVLVLMYLVLMAIAVDMGFGLHAPNLTQRH